MRPGAWPLQRAPGAFRLNRDSSQAIGLVFWAPLIGPAAREYITNQKLSALGTPTYSNFEGRPCWQFSTGNGFYLDSTIVTAAPFTLAAWGYGTVDTAQMSMVTIADTAADTEWFNLKWAGNIAGDPIRAEVVAASTATAANTTTGFVVNRWTHGAAVFTSGTSRTAYIDGGSKATAGGSRVPAGVDRIGIGYRATLTPGLTFTGGLYDIRIYNRTLSDAEIWALYDSATRWELYEPISQIWAGVGKAATCFPETLWPIGTKALNSEFLMMRSGPEDPGSVRLATGWTVGTSAPTLYSRIDSGVERAIADHTSTVQPSGAPDTSLGDGWRSDATYNGTFAAGNWSVSIDVRGQLRSTSTTDGRLRLRIWRSANEDGSSATEITSSTAVTTGYTNIVNTVSQTLTATIALGSVTLTNEYLILQAAHELTGAGDNAGCDVMLCRGSSTFLTTTAFCGVVTVGSSALVARTTGLTQAALVTFNGALSLSKALAISETGLANAKGSTTLAKLLAITESGRTTNAGGAVTLGRTDTLSASGRATAAKGAVTLSKALGITGTGLAAAKASTTLAKALVLTAFGRTTNAGAALTLARSDALTTSGRVTASGAVTLAIAKALVVSGSKTVAAVLALSRAEGLTASGSANARASVTLSRVQAISLAALRTVGASVLLSRTAGLSQSGRASVAYGAVTLSNTRALIFSGSKTVSAALSLIRTLTITQSGKVSAAYGAVTLGSNKLLSSAGRATTTASLILNTVRDLQISPIVITIGYVDVDIVLSLSKGLTAGAIASAKGATTLSKSNTVTETGLATAKGTIALSTVRVITEAARATFKSSLTLSKVLALTAVGSAAAKGALTLTTVRALTDSGRATAVGNLVLNTVRALQTSATTVAHGITDVAITLSLSKSLTASATTTAKATVSLVRHPAVAQSAKANTFAGTVLSKHTAVSLASRAQALANVSLNLIRLLTASGRATTHGSLSVNITLGLTSLGRAEVSGSVNLNKVQLLTLLAQAAAEANVSLLEVLGLQVSGNLFTFAITPPERTYWPPWENLETYVPADGQETGIPAEIRIYVVEGEVRVFDAATQRELDPNCLPELLEEVTVAVEERIYRLEEEYREFFVPIEAEREIAT